MAQFAEDAQKAMDIWSEFLTDRGWSYERDETDNVIHIELERDGRLTELMIEADEESGMLQIFSAVPVIIPEEKRVEAAMIANAFNDGRLFGGLNLDLFSGNMYFRISTCVADCVLSWQLCQNLIECVYLLIPDMIEKLRAFAGGSLSMEEMLAALNVL